MVYSFGELKNIEVRRDEKLKLKSRMWKGEWK